MIAVVIFTVGSLWQSKISDYFLSHGEWLCIKHVKKTKTFSKELYGVRKSRHGERKTSLLTLLAVSAIHCTESLK